MTFDIFTAYATDENLENNGTTFPLGKAADGASLLVARAGNRAYSKAITKAVETRRVELEADDTGKVSDEIMVEVMADTILLGWTALSIQGVDLPYSRVNAVKALSIRDFRKVVAGKSDDMDAYKFKVEAAAGNV